MYKLSIVVQKISPWTLYFITINPDVIGIYSLETLILHITRVDFAENTRNSFSGSNKKAISECLGCSNSTHMGRYKHKIVIKLSFSNLSITRWFW